MTSLTPHGQTATHMINPSVASLPRKQSFPTWIRDRGWRHAVAFLAIMFALLPVAWVLSASLNANPTLASADLIPRSITLDNFAELFADSSRPFLLWFRNSLIVAGANAFLNVLIAAFAAYAFSRFRFRGRRVGLMTLLLVQMFPQFLALVALYAIMVEISIVFPAIGLNSLAGLVLVYLGGAMGVNAWLIKGFFDTIPAELDESGRIDGATHAQIFWGIIMPLAAPVLAVVGLLSFIGTLNDFLLAGVLLQSPENWTLAVGMQSYIGNEYAERWGPFAAGALIASIPVVILFLFLQRFIVSGLTQGSVKG